LPGQWRPEAERTSALASSCVSDAFSTAEAPAASGTPEDASSSDAGAWRDELSARLNRYRSRRKVRPPRYPSLGLKFDNVESSRGVNGPGASLAPDFELISDHALALDGMTHGPSAANREVQFQNAPAREPTQQTVVPVGARAGAKIIEFPRFAWGPPPPPADQLAEPVGDRPRILDVPEVAPPAPALGGITMEAAEREEAEKRPGIDIPLQSAPLALRVLAALTDGLIIASGSALFGIVFWKVAAVRPPLVQIVGLAIGVTCLFWAAYQFLLIVYAGSTPGLRVAGLELARFDGSTAKRWRVLASYLSAVSLGMGYAWVFLDEDALCWHDRITHTYLAPKKG
jgi:uncharacterized RDD family membrane protein YckC